MKLHQDAAIAAIATAPSTGAVGIIRVSGAGAFEIADRVFFPRDGRPLSAHEPRRLIFGLARASSGEVLDNCLGVRMPGPSSYTGEDVAELQCHGGGGVMSLVLRALLDAGARMAVPGEFTRRAFLNGKLDLVQAEAVADLIDADWQGAVQNAAAQLSGTFGDRIRELYDKLRDLSAEYSAVMDYADQFVDAGDGSALRARLDGLDGELCSLCEGIAAGRIVKNGLRTCIAGRPNAGKSSLFNRLLGYARSIVTDEAGTTRDVVSEKALIAGVPLVLSDTAGIRGTQSAPERAGVALAREEAGRAELLLLVFDGGEPLTPEDEELIALARPGKTVLICNKSDLPRCDAAWARLQSAGHPVISISAVTGEGMDALLEEIRRMAGLSGASYDGMLVTNARQADALRTARDAVAAAKAAKDAGAEDAIWSALTDAVNAVGGILGIDVAEDVEERVFSRFCLGK